MQIANYLAKDRFQGFHDSKEEESFDITDEGSKEIYSSQDSLDSFIVSEEEDESYNGLEEAPVLKKRKLECLEPNQKANRRPMKKRKEENPIFSKGIIEVLSKDSAEIIGREEEIDEILRKIESGVRPLLTGAPFVGKKTLMRGVAERLSKKGIQVIHIDCVLLLAEILNKRAQSANCDFRKDLEVILTNNSQSLFYFEDLEHLLKDNDSKQYFKALVKQPLLITASIHDKESKIKKILGDLQGAHFVHYPVKEPSLTRQIEILKSKCDRKIKHTIVDKSMAEKVLELVRKYFPGEVATNKAYRLIKETSLSISKNQLVKLPDVAQILSKEIFIPSEILLSNGNLFFEEMERRLNQRIRLQNHAIDRLCDLVRRAKSPLLAPKYGPRLIAMLLGPTGVGKTETAKALAEELFHSSEAFIHLNMSEYKDKESISGLIGARPGFVGHENGGFLTKKVRSCPNCVILFDEIDKAHYAIYDLLLQILNDGRLCDADSEPVDFSGTYILFTSNIGSEHLFEEGKKTDTTVSSEIYVDLQAVFEDTILGRIKNFIPYNCICEEDKAELFEHILSQLSSNTVKLTWDPSVISYLCTLTCNLKLGFRELDRLVDQYIIKVLIAESKRRQHEFDRDIHLSCVKGKILVKELAKQKLKK